METDQAVICLKNFEGRDLETGKRVSGQIGKQIVCSQRMADSLVRAGQAEFVSSSETPAVIQAETEPETEVADKPKSVIPPAKSGKAGKAAKG